MMKTPHSPELEQAILAAFLQGEPEFSSQLASLRDIDFHVPANKLVLEAMRWLVAHRKPIFLPILTARMREAGTFDRLGKDDSYLVAIANNDAGYSVTASLETHLESLRRFTTRRELHKATMETAQEALTGTGDASALVDTLAGKLSALEGHQAAREGMPIGEVLVATQKMLKEPRQSGMIGLSTGLRDLDLFTQGMGKQELITVAGRTGDGKTAFAMCAARAVAYVAELPVAIYSLEMSRTELGLRWLSQATGYNMADIRAGTLTSGQKVVLDRTVEEMQGVPLYIVDAPYMSMHDIAAHARALQRDRGLALTIIDYLQLVEMGTAENQNLRVAAASRAAKLMAKELDIPVMQLCQLSRSAAKRDGGRPILEDLRDSGSIENDSDWVVFVYREWERLAEQARREKPHLYRHAEITVAKKRNGPTGTIGVTWQPSTMQFKDAERQLGFE